MTKVLVVDDEPDVTEVIGDLLEWKGYEVAEANCASSARKNMESGSFDIVFSDIRMPEMSGIELLQFVQHTSPRSKVILMTGSPTLDTAMAAVREDAFGYLPKPVSSETILQIVSQAEQILRLEDENARYKQHLEELVEEKTRELKESQQQLLQSQKMEAIGRLAGGVAHDFNNLLTGINGYAELVLMELPQGDGLRDDILQIKKAAGQAADLTSQLLAFSRKQMIEPKILNLDHIISQSNKLLTRIIGEDVTLEYSSPSDPWAVEADPGQISQILVNLVTNSRDAMTDGGRILMKTENLTLAEEKRARNETIPKGEYVLLSVEDTGEGMSQETAARIFEPFFTTKPLGQGTGLGLSTVYGIVKQNLWFIDFESEHKAGTVFRIYIPRSDRDATSIMSFAPNKNIPGGRELILLVEDSSQVRHVASKILKNQGYSVIACRSAEEAEREAQHLGQQISLLLTDVVLPEANGRILYEKIRADNPSMKVLYMSGYSADVITRHGVLEEGIQFLSKPFTIETFSKRVRETLDLPADA